MSTMLSRAVQTAVAASRVPQRSAVGVFSRAFASDAPSGGDKKQQPRAPRQYQPRDNKGGNKNLRFGGQQDGEPRAERKFSFALKDKNRGDDNRKPRGDAGSERAPAAGGNRKKFSFAPSVKAKEKEPELEVFEKPAYWNEDFPAEFDDSMKHEVEKLEVFADFTMLIDSAWQKQIHPLFDGAAIELTLNAPLEDYDERLFIDDKNTFDTKVVMEVPLTCFSGLTPAGLEFVKQLAGPRYQANKKQLKLTEDRYPSRVHNHKRLCDILRDLTQTASELAAAQTAEAQQ